MSSNSTSAAAPTSPSSNPVPSSNPPSSTPPPPPPPSTSPSPTPTPTPTPSSNPPPPSSTDIPTSVVTASSPPPVTTVITQTVAPTSPGQSPSVIVITVVTTRPPSNPTGVDSSPSGPPASTGTTDPKLQELKNAKPTSGLGPSGKTAIAVVVPVVVVALLVLAGIILWRKRKQRKSAEEARRKEVEEYGYNPNHDPTLPAVGMQSEMAEDQSGYRGWGNTTSSNRQASTTLNSGMAYSDSNSNPGGYTSPGSPTVAGSDGHSLDPLMNGRRETLDSEGIGALGAAPAAGQNQAGVHRGPSNASSSYSAAGHSDSSDNYPLPMTNPQEYYDNNNYYGHNPYDSNGYGGGGQPVIRDVSARRNTRIENPSIFPQQGNSGIAQNF